MYPRLLQFGHIAIPTYGVFAALALLAALALALWMSRRLGLDSSRVWNVCLIGIFTVLLSSRLLLIVLHLRDFFAHPFWMLGVVTVRSEGAFYGSVLLAICICYGYILASSLPLRRTLDCLAPPAALGWMVGAIGSFFAGSNYGSQTSMPWGIVYRHALATLWSGTPLGVRVHPVQLYEAAALLILLVVLYLLRNRQDGDLAATFLAGYGSILYFLDFYRGDRNFLLHGILTASQLFAVILLFFGMVLFLRPAAARR